MWLVAAHLAAGVAVALWLAVGERALWTVIGLAGRLALRALVALRALGAVPLVRPLPVPDSVPVGTGLRILSRCVVRRGPPLLLAA